MGYWISTLLIAGFLMLSSYTYFFSQNTIQGLKELGFPDFFRIQLGVLKILGAIILLLKPVPVFAKDWAYAGAAFFLITAMVAHIVHRDSPLIFVILVLLFAALIVSRYTLQTAI